MNGIALLLGVAGVLGGPPDARVDAEPAVEAVEEAPSDEDIWEFTASLYGYAVRDGRDYLALTLMADRDWLHLEGRFNYENFDTASLFVGYNIAAGETVRLAATPMIGGIVGDTDGIAPGYEITLGYKWLELYTEGEFVFDLNSSDDDYFYSWSELTVSPTDWVYGGLAAQRTKLREEASDVQLGPMLGFAYKNVDLSLYLFSPGDEEQVFATAFSVHF